MYKLKINGLDIVPSVNDMFVSVHIESDDYSYTFTPNVPTLVENLHVLMAKSFGLNINEFNKLIKRTE